MTWIGKVLNPVFLVMLGILVLRALSAPMGTPGDMVPESAYESGAFSPDSWRDIIPWMHWRDWPLESW